MEGFDEDMIRCELLSVVSVGNYSKTGQVSQLLKGVCKCQRVST